MYWFRVLCCSTAVSLRCVVHVVVVVVVVVVHVLMRA
jgi:hypothetical protein